MAELFEEFTRARDTQVRFVSPKLRLAAFSLLSAARAGSDPLSLDELSVDLCQAILEGGTVDFPDVLNGRGATLARARQYLHARYRDPISLADVACEVGVTPVYLTQLFKRSLGMALHQYLIALRLSEALLALPEAEDLTALAFDLGFSSHSHFTSVFRSKFGVTPSSLRRRHEHQGETELRVQFIFPQRPLCVERGGDPTDELM
jgi:AraC family transcriptional regulator